jgi:N-acetylglucosamine-6-sulfatase
MLMHCPELFKAGTVVEQVVANIDIAPTVLEAAGLQTPNQMAGMSFVSVAQGKPTTWRDGLLYEYYWERNFPQTPTQHALRGSRYKYIHYHGIWDTDELYDLQNDPLETTNLIFSEAHQATIKQMNEQLFVTLAQSQGMYIPLYADRGGVNRLRRKGGAKTADFPAPFIRDQGLKNQK